MILATKEQMIFRRKELRYSRRKIQNLNNFAIKSQ